MSSRFDPEEPIVRSDIRYPEVAKFAQLMLIELYANRHKGDQEVWKAFPNDHWPQEIAWHLVKLMTAHHDQNWVKVKEHAADIANGAMMMLDGLGLLSTEE